MNGVRRNSQTPSTKPGQAHPGSGRLRARQLMQKLLVIGALLAGINPLLAQSAVETPQQHDARMAWWREARFGLFIHWGLYAIPEGEWNGKKTYGEWIRHSAKIPRDQYDQFVGRFNPTNFNAARWASLAKRAGMKYLVITSKHHDGFCLWDSKLAEFDVASTPFKRDVLGELEAACRAEGIRFCTYHSIMDWHHPDYLPRRPWETNRPTTGADFDRYVNYMNGQLKELTARYRPAVMWFDGEWEDTWTHEGGIALYAYMRSLDPTIIVNNRVDKGRRGVVGMNKEGSFRGDFGTPEQQIPAAGFGAGVDWESCMTMNAHWGWNKADSKWKSTEELVRKLVDIASKGGNFLLNVGPKPDGTFPNEAIERLEGMGRWMDVNGEAIYGTGPTLFGAEAGRFSETEKDKEGRPKFIPAWEWRCTTKAGKIYIHVFNWPAGELKLPAIKSKVTKAYLLADRSVHLAVRQSEAGLNITLPRRAPDAIASVLCLEAQ